MTGVRLKGVRFFCFYLKTESFKVIEIGLCSILYFFDELFRLFSFLRSARIPLGFHFGRQSLWVHLFGKIHVLMVLPPAMGFSRRQWSLSS